MNPSAEPKGAGGPQAGARRTRSGPLSKREREVFELLAEGYSGAEIAEALVLSPETVRTHIRNAMGKLGASTRSQAVVIALHRREITLRPEPGGAAERRLPEADRTATADELEEPLEILLDGLLELWDVDGGWAYLIDEGGLGLHRIAVRGATGAETLALGEGPLGRAALERRPQIVQARGAESGAMIVVPLLSGNRLIGVLGIETRPSRPTGRQELLLLQALAGEDRRAPEGAGTSAQGRRRTRPGRVHRLLGGLHPRCLASRGP